MRPTVKQNLIVALAGLLSACATTPAPPAVEVRTVTVDRPVAIQCAKRSDIPAEPTHIAKDLTGDARRDLDLVSASAIALRQAFHEAAALLSGCVKEN